MRDMALARFGLLGLSLAACADPTTTSSSRPIVNGTVDTGDPAVVILDLGGGLCTGTVISPHVVLTAGHCIDGGTIRARFENEYGDGGPVIDSVETDAHPSADLGLVALGQPAAVAPVPHNQAPLEAHLGEPVRIVGFGVTSENGSDSGLKRQGTATLDSVLPGGEIATTNDPQGTCYGDSGGPNFMTLGGVEVVAGVTSRGTDICGAGLDIAVRADSYQDWIEAFVAAHDPATCQADGMCVAGCTPVDPDCCGADGACTTACGSVDPDCAPETPDAGVPGEGAPDAGDDPGVGDDRDEGAITGGCAAGRDAASGVLVLVAALLLPRRRRRTR